MIGFRLDGENWCVPLLRAASQGHFAPEETEALGRLAPHFRRMIRLSERLAQDRPVTGISVLEKMRGAALLVGSGGSVFAMNKRAEVLLGHGIYIRNGTLETADQTSRASLYALIASTRAMASSSAAPCDPIVIRRPDARPLIVEAFPAQGLLSDVFSNFGALILLTDLDERCGPGEETLRQVLGLTPAEARLLACICQGHGLPDAAQTLQISIHTARSQLKSVFAKTGTGRQSELVALASGIGRLARSGEV
jgi:DNA-binding CsgD family transcriptional regulator